MRWLLCFFGRHAYEPTAIFPWAEALTDKPSPTHDCCKHCGMPR
jgi:hypothetical protein